jgi:hypothetical protein
MDTENVKMIKTGIENIFIFEDRYVFSQANNISELNAKPDRYTRLALIILSVIGVMVAIVFVTICVYLQRDFNFFNMDSTASIILFIGVGLMFSALFVNNRSRKSVVYKKDVIRIYIDEKINCLAFRFKEGRKRVKIRIVALPADINEKEKMALTLYENNLIGKDMTSQIVEMKEGFLYVREKTVSFVDFKLYSQHIDAVRHKYETYQLLGFGVFVCLSAFVASIVVFYMTGLFIMCVILTVGSVSYFMFLYRQFINSKTFSLKRNRIAGFSVDNNDAMTVTLHYYAKNKQLKHRKLVLSDTTPAKDGVEFVKKYFPNSAYLSNCSEIN